MFFKRKKSSSAAESLDPSSHGACCLTAGSAAPSVASSTRVEAGRGSCSPNLQIATPPTATPSGHVASTDHVCSTDTESSPEVALLDVTFEIFAPGAKSVSVAGTFNNWRTGVDFLRGGPNGKWSGSLRLPAGRYEYRYMVDGDWRNDQRPVESVPNPFGTYNSVIVVV